MQINIKGNYLKYFCLIIFLLITFHVAYYSPGYDDEFHNIRQFYEASINGSISDYWYQANKDSVHPPGSYLISFVGMYLLNDWAIVRLLKTIIVILVTYISLIKLFPRLKSNKIDYAIIVIITPSFLMYGSGLRWGGEFLAIYTLMVALDKFISLDKKYFFLVLFGLGFLLINVNYLGVILFPLVILYHIYNLYKHSRKILTSSIFFIIFGLSYSAKVLISLLIGNTSSSQIGNLFESLIGVGHGILVNWGVFPISIIGVSSALALFTAAIVVILNNYKKLKNDSIFWLIVTSILFMILSGLGIKFRNTLPLLPIIYGYFIHIIILNFQNYSKQVRNTLKVCLIPIIVSQIMGYYGVINHVNTAKGSWNLPVKNVSKFLINKRSECDSVKIFLWDPVLEYNLWSDGFDVATLSNVERFQRVNFNEECFFLVETTSGSMGSFDFFKKKFQFGDPISVHGFDKFYAIKRKLLADAPEYYVSIYKLDDNMLGEIGKYFLPTKYAR